PVVGEDGTASGLTQQAILRAAQGETVRLDLTMSWRLDDPGDTISVDGDPPLVVAIPGGYHGDSGTTAQVVRALERSDRLPPGFYRPTDLPLRPI
ncbi:MAG: dihydrodipicolinate reductase, partial [Acidimicrobiia bacterium]